MAARHAALALALAASAATLAFETGCEEFRCCNSCGRNYTLQDENGESVAWVSNTSEGGNECEIDGVARAFEDRPYVLLVETLESGGTVTQIDVIDSGADGDVSPCDGLELSPAALLLDAEAGQTLCVEAEVRAETLCTQLACAGS